MLSRYQGVFKCLNAHEVKYLVIGGVAAVVHGVPRTTYDIDLLIEATEDNARRLLAAFLEAGMGTASLTTPQQLVAHEITVFRDIYHLDVMTKTPGIEFAQAWEQREMRPAGAEHCFIISRQDVINSKRAAGRPKDLEDVQMLEAGEPPSNP
jgi:hypothetical protein